MNFFRKYIWGKRAVPQPQVGVPVPGMPGAEHFNFSENIVANAASGKAGAYSPAPGTAVLEVLSGNGIQLAMDTIRVNEPASPGAYHAGINGDIPATFVRMGNGQKHQMFEIPLTDEWSPFKLPDPILAKREIGGQRLRIYWSCQVK
jgi:hypothetical protein